MKIISFQCTQTTLEPGDSASQMQLLVPSQASSYRPNVSSSRRNLFPDQPTGPCELRLNC